MISKIGIGTVQFGLKYGISNFKGQTKINEVKKILEYSRVKNIDVIDTAVTYGSSEEILGKNNLTDFKVVSKFSIPGPGSVISQFKSSLTSLKIKSVYGYLAHRPLELIQNKLDWDELYKLKNDGFIKKIGYSLNNPEELELLLENNLIPDLVQIPYNYIDNRFNAYLMDLKNIGCEIHARSAFLQGLFFTDPSTLPNYFNEVKPIVKELQNQISDLPSALLNYVVNQPLIDKVIIGVESLAQLEENLENMENCTKLPSNNLLFKDNILMPSNWPINNN
jgi:aryl-alcohol dehydrogenase-like predicted oxidoreductase